MSARTIFWAIILCPVLPCLIFYFTFTDVPLNEYTSFVFLTCALIFIASCFINLSAVASLRIKELARDIPIDTLSESDLESDDEKDGIVPVEKCRFTSIPLILRNFIAFSRFHFSYGILSALGGICLTTAIVFGILKLSMEMDMTTQEDLGHCVFVLMVPGITLPAIVLTVANGKELYIEDTSYLKYNTFDEFIRVPMKVVAGRTFADFLTGGYKYILQLGLGLVLFVYGLYAFLSLLSMTEDDIRVWQHATQIGNIRFILLAIMISAVVTGIVLVFTVTNHSYKRAKQSLLVIMEQNWQRNLSACELLLKIENSNTLYGLKKALQEKAEIKMLTMEERQAFEYLTLPLWKPKRAFAEKRK